MVIRRSNFMKMSSLTLDRPSGLRLWVWTTLNLTLVILMFASNFGPCSAQTENNTSPFYENSTDIYQSTSDVITNGTGSEDVQTNASQTDPTTTLNATGTGVTVNGTTLTGNHGNGTNDTEAASDDVTGTQGTVGATSTGTDGGADVTTVLATSDNMTDAATTRRPSDNNNNNGGGGGGETPVVTVKKRGSDTRMLVGMGAGFAFLVGLILVVGGIWLCCCKRFCETDKRKVAPTDLRT